jgi:aspartyl/asparaginyl beta-hydroxylase (cupin superfamily)
MPVSMRDKIELYENFLKKIAAIDVEKECTDALEDPHNLGVPGTQDFISRYPFAFGMVSQSFKNAVSDAQYALNQGAKK